MVYGGSSSMIRYMLFASARQGQVTWYGDESTTMPTTHNHDLAKAFVLCAEKASRVVRVAIKVRRLTLYCLFSLTACQALSSTCVSWLAFPRTELPNFDLYNSEINR